MKSNSYKRKKLILALLPGINHMIEGRRRGGIALLSLSIMLIMISIFKREQILFCLDSESISLWSAPLFFFLICLSCLFYSFIFVIHPGKGEASDSKSISPMQFAMRRFSANRIASGSAYLLLILFITAFLSPILAPYDPYAISDVMNTRYLPPSLDHLFGTDALGRDLFSRALYGARISLSVGVLSVMISISLGTIYGAIAGFFGGITDNILMRLVDVIISFPVFFLMLMLIGVFQTNLTILILILGLTSWPGTARYIRGEILSLRERGYIESSRAIGLPSHLIIWRHLIPNALSPVLVSAALMVGGMITAEAGLSFLGIGINPPTPSWGNMISGGQQAVFTGWWIAFFPGLLLTCTILCFNLLADGLRDALDTKTLMRKYI